MDKEYEKLIKSDKGRMPPNAIDLEENILGAILVEGEKAFTEAALILNSNDEFYKEQNQLIWNTINSLIENKISIDTSVVIQKLRTSGKIDEVGGLMYIMNLANGVASGAHIRAHAMLVKQVSIQRKIIEISHQAQLKAYKGDGDISEIRDYLDDELSNAFMSYNSAMTTKIAIEKTLELIKDIKDGVIASRKRTNTPLDNIFHIVRNEMIWFFAAAKAGKTKVTTQLISSLLKNNDDIAVRWFSMEDPIESIWSHFGTIETGTNLYRVLGQDDKNKLSDKEFDEFKLGLSVYAKKDMEITYGSYSIGKLATEAKQFVSKRKEKFNIIVIDNFNILTSHVKQGTPTEQETYVADKIQDLKIETNKQGFNTLIYVIDHAKKQNDLEGLERGFRLSKGDLKGSSRKQDVLTQLIMANRPGVSDELMQEERMKGTIKIGRKKFDRAELLKNLTILDVAISRNADTVDQMLKLIFDYGTMEMVEYKDYIKNSVSKNGKIVPSKKKFEPNKKHIELKDDGSSVFDDEVIDRPTETITKEEPKLEGSKIDIDKDGEELVF